MNWTQVLESLGSVAVVALPPLIAHYRKLGQVLEILTTLLVSARSVEEKLGEQSVTPVQVYTSSPRTGPGGGMFNENTD